MTRRRENYLFAEKDLGDALRGRAHSVPSRVDSISKDQFLASTDEQILDHVSSDLHVDAITLYEDRAEMDEAETKVDVTGWSGRDWDADRRGPLLIPGTDVKVSIPFTGDPALWKMRPSQWSSTIPFGDISEPRGEQPGSLILSMAKPHDTAKEEFKRDLDRLLKDVRFYLEGQLKDIDTFNNGLASQIKAAIAARRERIKKHDGLSQILNIPLKRREGAPPIAPIKVEKKITKPLPPPPKSGFKPEPGIDAALYEEILLIIRHEGRTYETTPKTYVVHDEEELRDIQLAHLNGHYQGGATGETFRRSGKTDIRIEDDTRAAFIAECKVWRGAKELLGAIDQLVGYLTWRDCKAALIIFNKDVAGFTQLLDTLPKALSTHPLRIKDLGPRGPGEWRHTFRSREDEQRYITVHTFLFNLYVGK